MKNNLIKEFDDGGPSMEDMGFDFQDILHPKNEDACFLDDRESSNYLGSGFQDFRHHKNSNYERIEYQDGLVIFRDKTGKWKYNNKLSTTELLYEMENQSK